MSEEDFPRIALVRPEPATLRVENRPVGCARGHHRTRDAASIPEAPHELEALCAPDGSLAPPPYSESECDEAADPPFENGAVEIVADEAGADAAEVVPLGPVTIRPPSREEAIAPLVEEKSDWTLAISLIACILFAAAGWLFTKGDPNACWLSDLRQFAMSSSSTTEAVARGIITVESSGDAIAENELSSATGAGQFLDGTWLEMVRAYRPDLARQRETEILDLRRDADLSREMVVRLAERNAATLMRRCLPVTPGTLYLSHFAGGAGALAVLSAPESADAAATMAKADSTGRTTRKMIVTANPFLEGFTVADLKEWADRKMRFAGRSHLSAK
jgi:hypothetical protein